MPNLQLLFCGVILVLGLSACAPSPEKGELSHQQSFYLLESLKKIEAGGARLSSNAGAKADSHEAQENMRIALDSIDAGMELAFKVDAKKLQNFDYELAKKYQALMIEGTQNYRLGIEVGDPKKQQKGLRLLQQWSLYWNLERVGILARLKPV